MSPDWNSAVTCAGPAKPAKAVSSAEAGRGTHAPFCVGEGTRSERSAIAPGNEFVPSRLSLRPRGRHLVARPGKFRLTGYQGIIFVERSLDHEVPNDLGSSFTLTLLVSLFPSLAMNFFRSFSAIASIAPARVSPVVSIISAVKRWRMYCWLGNHGTTLLVSGAVMSAICRE